MKKHPKNGFIALMSAVIISVVLLLMITTMSFTEFYGRLNVADFEYKKRSSALAEGDVDAALLKLANEPSYVGTETVNIGGDSYTYTMKDLGSNKIIETQAIFQNAYTNLRVVVKSATREVISWEEIP